MRPTAATSPTDSTLGNNAAGDYIYTTTATVNVGSTAGEDAPDRAVRLALSAPHPEPGPDGPGHAAP